VLLLSLVPTRPPMLTGSAEVHGEACTVLFSHMTLGVSGVPDPTTGFVAVEANPCTKCLGIGPRYAKFQSVQCSATPT